MQRTLFTYRNIADKAKKSLRNPEIARFYIETYLLARLQGVEPDIYLVSYPKCGRNWLRAMLTAYLAQRRFTPRTYLDKSLMPLPDGRIAKFDHDLGNWVPSPLPPAKVRYRGEKYNGKLVALLVRDPRDIVVSSWYHLRYRENIYHGDLSAFIREPLVGIHKVIHFMNTWLAAQDRPAGFLLLPYEEMRAQPEAMLSRLLEFMGLGAAPGQVAQAVAECQFARMQAKERSGGFREPWMKPAGPGDQGLKVRKGKVGGYREELSAADIAFLDQAVARHLTPELPYGRAAAAEAAP